VIHAVGPVWNGGGEGESLLLADAHRSALDLAVAEACRTVAFPAISTGVYHYPVDAAAGVAIGTVTAWLDEHADALDLVTFVLFSGAALDVFEQALARA
jgi:O-acetyl-ADP-ribose deacetylase (regulator of RNase III)